MKRWIFNFLAGLSLLLLVAVVVIWGRSYGLADQFEGGCWRFHPVTNQPITAAAELERGKALEITHFRGCWLIRWLDRLVRPKWPDGKHWRHSSYVVSEVEPFFNDGANYGWDGILAFGSVGDSELRFVVSDLLLALATSVMPSIWAMQWLRCRSRIGQQRCPSCGYNLRATPERCPECGLSCTTTHKDWRRPLYFVLGWAFVVLATLGVFLPLLPTTPFLLLASSCFLRSSPRWQAWLMRSRWFGPMLRDWNEHRAVRRPVKVVAILTVSTVLLFAVIRDLHWAIRAGIFLLGGIGLWVVWRLPVRAGGSRGEESAASGSSSVVTAPLEPTDKKMT